MRLVALAAAGASDGIAPTKGATALPVGALARYIKAMRDRRNGPRPNPERSDEYQRFVEMAREVEADESPEAMDRAFEKVILRKRPTAPPTSQSSSGGRTKR